MTLTDRIKRIVPVGEVYRVQDVARILGVTADEVIDATVRADPDCWSTRANFIGRSR